MLCAASASAQDKPADPQLSAIFDPVAREILINVTAPTNYCIYENWMWTPTDPIPEDKTMEITVTIAENISSWESGPTQKIGTYQATPGEAIAPIHYYDFTPGKTYWIDAEVNLDGETSPGRYSGYTLFAGIQPMAVSDLTITSDEGHAPVTVTFVTPTLTRDYEPLEYPLTAVTIERRIGDSYGTPWDVIHVFENPESGALIEFVDDSEAVMEINGANVWYNVTASCEWGTSDSNNDKVALFPNDAPGEPQIIATDKVDGGVLVKWEPNPLGSHDGNYDPNAVKYDVYRGYDWTSIYFDWNSETYDITGCDLLAEDIEATEFFDSLSDINEPIYVRYYVLAKNDAGSTMSNIYGAVSILVGPEYNSFPFYENFSNVSGWSCYADHIWERSLDYPYWSFVRYQEVYDEQWNPTVYHGMSNTIEGFDGDDGFADLSNPQWGMTSEPTITSTPIDISDLVGQATLGFYMINFPTATDQYVVAEAIFDDEEPVELLRADMCNGVEGEWNAYSAILPETDAKTVCLRFRGVYDGIGSGSGYDPNSRFYSIDNISLTGEVKAETVNGFEAQTVATRWFNLQGIEVAHPSKGEVVIEVRSLSNGTSKAVKRVIR